MVTPEVRLEAGLIPLLVCLASCASPLEAPSAFSSERFLCDQEHLGEFDALVEQCRQTRIRDQSCAGYVSFRGVIDKQPVVMDAPVFRSTYADSTDLAGGTSSRDFFWAALAPYFEASLHTGLLKDPTTGQPTSAPSVIERPILNLVARGGNYFALLVAPTYDLQFRTPEEVRISFSSNLSRGGSIEGCFDGFPVPLNGR